MITLVVPTAQAPLAIASTRLVGWINPAAVGLGLVPLPPRCPVPLGQIPDASAHSRASAASPVTPGPVSGSRFHRAA